MIGQEFNHILFDQLLDIMYQYNWTSDKVYILCKDLDFSKVKNVLEKISIKEFDTCRVYDKHYDIAISFNHSFIDKNYLSSIKGIQKYNL